MALMKPDSLTGDVERAHLVDPADTSYRIHRYPAPDEVADLLRRFWIPVWSVTPGQESAQQVLQYPVCLVVVRDDTADLFGVATGCSATTLAGSGWAVGLLLQPAAGSLLVGGDVSTVTDRRVRLEEVLGPAGRRLASDVRAVMSAGPDAREHHAAAMELFLDVLRRHLPVDAEGLLVNDLVSWVETEPGVRRVEQLCDRAQLSERSLQRLLRRRIGLTPRWLIQRRRLHEAAGRLREHPGSLADVAAELGYADQAHFTRDFRRVTGLTPGQFAARFRHERA
jgi:AraC-like DNA-binding protein